MKKKLKILMKLKKKRQMNLTILVLIQKKKIIDLLNPLITNYLKKESIQILLQKDKIIFGDDKLNITQDILKLFDDKYKKIKFE